MSTQKQKRPFALRALAAFAGTLAILFVLLLAAYALPGERVRQHVYDSARTIQNEGLYPQYLGFKLFQMDNYTDTLMLFEAASAYELPPLQAMMTNTAYNVDNFETLADDLAWYIEKDWSTGAQRTDAPALEPFSYARYWHGYLIWLRPLLLLMPYTGVRIVQYIVLFSLLAVVLVLGLAPAALAAAPAEEEAAQVLAALDIMVGDESGNLNLGATVTRAEFTKLAVAASTSRDAVGDTVSVKPYPDVPQSHWAAPYIKAAVDLGLVQGDLHGNFNPGRSITLAEGVTIVLRLLGYQDSDFTGVWPSGQMAQYRALKLNEGVTAGQDSAMTRRDALYLFYNLMITKNKEGSYYLNVLEPTLSLVNAAGELDRVALINSAMEGPVVAAAGWQSSVPFDAGSATVYRNGSKSSLAAVQNQDVVYWSESMHTLWAYSDKITGTYEAASPSVTNPTSVTVAGKSYTIETTSAAYALSDLGGYQIGDSVTLLLGRSGGVAAVGEAVAADNLIYGVVTKVESTSYDDGKGGTYNARTVTVAGTDGGSYRYQTDNKSLDEGDLVRVNTDGDTIEVKRLTTSTLTGKMSNDGTKLGTYPLADDVQILDTYESCTPIRIYPDRLKGVKFDGNMVRFYALNAQGEISHLILNDVTGDLHQYGVITSVEELDLGTMMGISSSYTYDVGGQKLTFGSTNAIYNLKVGPCQIKMEGPNAVERLYNLSERKLDSVSGSTAVGTNNQKYTLSDNVAVYVYEGGEYQLSSLARISGGNYSLTGWYDKDESAGGRIRVIIAR